MRVLQRFERRIERIVNGAFARAFKAEVEPVEIASALERECDDRAAIVARGRVMVPNEFVVELGRSDFDRLSVYAEPLGAELADMVVEHAEEQGYSFVGPVSVSFEHIEELDTGVFRVRSAAARSAPAPARPAAAPPQPVAAPPPAAPPAPGPARSATNHWLELDGTRIPLVGDRTTLGRGAESDVRVDDPGVSRRHAEIRMTPDGATIVDLGSTNGVLVDGRRGEHVPLSDGSQVRLGSTTFIYRTAAR